MKSHNLFSGLLLIFFGAIFLLNNFGIIGWDIWFTFLSFWPLFLIALGLRIMFRHNLVIQLVALLLILVVPLGYYLGFGPYNAFTRGVQETGHYETHNWALERDANLNKGKLKLEFGAGKLTVNPTDKLVDLQASTAAGKPDINVDRNNDFTAISIKQEFKNIPFSLMWSQGGWKEDYILGLGKEVVWDLEFDTGATQAEFNFQEIKISQLKLDTGAGDIRLVFGDTGTNAQVKVDSGAGNITLVIPENVGVKAKIDTGVGQKNLPGRTWQQQGDDTFISNNFDQASSKIVLDLDHGVGNVNIVTEGAKTNI